MDESYEVSEFMSNVYKIKRGIPLSPVEMLSTARTIDDYQNRRLDTDDYQSIDVYLSRLDNETVLRLRELYGQYNASVSTSPVPYSLPAVSKESVSASLSAIQDDTSLVEMLEDEVQEKIDLLDIYTREAIEAFSIKNIFFGDQTAYETFHSGFRSSDERSRKTRAASSRLGDFLNGYYERVIEGKSRERARTREEAEAFFQEVNKSIQTFILGNITNVIRPYIYRSINILNRVMNDYGKFIIGGGEAFNFNVRKQNRAVTPDIDTKFVSFYSDINEQEHGLFNINNPVSYTDFLLSLNKMWYDGADRVLSYLNRHYNEFYPQLQQLESLPEFMLLQVKFTPPLRPSQNAVFRKRLGIFDKKASEEGSIFFNLPLFSFDMSLDGYLGTERRLREVPLEDEDDDDDDAMPEHTKPDEVIVYTKDLVRNTTIQGILDCPFMKPNENGYDVGFKGMHAEIVSSWRGSCTYKMLYASRKYLVEDINKLIVLRLRKGKSDKDLYRQEIMSNASNVIDLLYTHKNSLPPCSPGEEEEKDLTAKCSWNNLEACNFSPIGLAKILSFCAPPKWVILPDRLIHQEHGIIERNYLDRKCCTAYATETLQRIVPVLTTSFYDYTRNQWMIEPPVTEQNEDSVDLYLDPDIKFRFNKTYFNRFGAPKEVASMIKYDIEAIINQMIVYLTTIKQKFDQSSKTDQDKNMLKDLVGRMCLFYNPRLVDHSAVTLKDVSNLVRLFTGGLLYHSVYGVSGVTIDKLLVFIGEETNIVSDPPPPEQVPSFNDIVGNISIQQIRDDSIEIKVYRKPDRVIPRDLYKIAIVQEPENLRKLSYIENFFQRGVLDEQDLEALYFYVTKSMTLNRKLRQNATSYDIYDKTLYNNLITAIDKSPRNEYPVTVYRGLAAENIDSNYIRRLYENGRVSSQFTSVSISPAVAYNFAKGNSCCVLKLYILGVQMIYLEPLQIEKFKNEYELLLPPGVVLYYLGSSVTNVYEGDEVIGSIDIVECVATQLPEPIYREYIENYKRTHGLNLTDAQKRAKAPLRRLLKKKK